MKAVYIIRRCVLLLLLCFLSSNSNSFAQGKRIALIWGNATYIGKWQSLPVVENDVNAMKVALESLGIETFPILLDGTRDEMVKSFRDFKSKAKNADVAIFYYSGHGVEIDGQQYFVPAKTNLDDYLAADMISANDIESVLEKKGSHLNILFYDCCRDIVSNRDSEQNDLEQIRDEGKGPEQKFVVSVSSDKVGPSADYATKESPIGTMVCYATKRGKKAFSNEKGNLSDFTKVLINHISDGDEFRDVWNNIINDMAALYGPKQKPDNRGFYRNSLYLNPKGRKYIAPTQSLISHTSKKSVEFSANLPDAKINFYGTEYNMGKPLLFDIGKSYTYTVSAKGYKQYTGRIDITESTPSVINVTLEKDESATLRVTSNASASVNFDNKYMGKTPLTIYTTSGAHSLSLSAKGYNNYSSQLDLSVGSNSRYAIMTPETPWFFDWDEWNAPKHYVSYNFSPKYQIGVQYMHRISGSKFLIGGNYALSKDFLKGSGKRGYTYDPSSEVLQDPFNEGKMYDSNLLLLLTGGYNPCNGVVLELGLGAAANSNVMYLPYDFTYTKYMESKNGEIVGEPRYEYIRQEGSRWYFGKVKWSPAMRLGTKFNIPLSDDWYITLGGGYSYLFTNRKCSSWDASAGVAFII